MAQRIVNGKRAGADFSGVLWHRGSLLFQPCGKCCHSIANRSRLEPCQPIAALRHVDRKGLGEIACGEVALEHQGWGKRDARSLQGRLHHGTEESKTMPFILGEARPASENQSGHSSER